MSGFRELLGGWMMGNSIGVPTMAVWGLIVWDAASGKEKPIMIGLSLGDRSCSTGARAIFDTGALPLGACDGFFFSQLKLPTVAVEGSPSSALRAAASTNLPRLGSIASNPGFI
jgi:hypothetical protein